MHHSRRRSGHGLPNTSMTDVRRAVHADSTSTSSATKHKSSSKQSSGNSGRRSSGALSASKSSKSAASSRDAEKDHNIVDDDDDYWYEEERESFPQYCMTCEKQFVAKDNRYLYCSEECRDYDLRHGTTISTQHFMESYNTMPRGPVYVSSSEPRDIIPRASPSRPSSNYFSPPSTPAKTTSSTLPTAASASSAMAALRQLSIRDVSPPSPTGLAPSGGSGIWPFTSTRSAGVSPSTSYTRPSASIFASTYDAGYYRTGALNYYGTRSGTSGMAERPLPARRPGSYSRPKSIELVTPLIGQ